MRRPLPITASSTLHVWAVRSGSFQAETASLQCTPCEPGTFSPTKGSTACQACATGGFCEEVGASSASVFKLCPTGTWSDTIGLNSSEGCFPCGEGTYQPITGANSSSSCLACPAGTASATLGVQFCLRCPGGSYQNATSGTACFPCTAGSYCPEGSSVALPCPPGTVGNDESLTSQQQCEPCPKGHWCSAGRKIACSVNTFQPAISKDFAGACKQCPDDAVSSIGSTSIQDCQCRTGYYGDSRVNANAASNVTCKLCIAGSKCGSVIGITIETLPMKECYYRASSKSDDLRRCPDCDHDSGCVGGVGEGEGPCKEWLRVRTLALALALALA